MKRFLATLLILTSMLGLCACAPAQQGKYLGTWVDELGNHAIVLEEENGKLKAYLNDGTVYDWGIALQPKVSFRQPKYTVLYDTIEFYMPDTNTNAEEGATGPAADVTEPVADVTEPVADVTEPAADVTEPVADATEPVADATEPVADATEPVADATEANTPATASELPTEATEPEVDATEPAVDATEPAADATEPVADATEPAADATEPVADATEPVADATEPATEATQPAKGTLMLTGKLTIKNGLMTLTIIDPNGRELYTLTKRY